MIEEVQLQFVAKRSSVGYLRETMKTLTLAFKILHDIYSGCPEWKDSRAIAIDNI